MSKHTEGPWKITDHNRAGDIYIGRDKGLHVAIIPPASPFVPDQEANARLIAAAPETKEQRDALLAACKLAVEPLSEGGECGLPAITYNLVCRAIAKAID